MPPSGEPFAILDDDIVVDILQRVRAAFGHSLAPAIIVRIEQEIRRDWGGSREYIAKGGEVGRRYISGRNEQIRAQHRRGDHVELLARRWGMCERRIRQIILAA